MVTDFYRTGCHWLPVNKQRTTAWQSSIRAVLPSNTRHMENKLLTYRYMFLTHLYLNELFEYKQFLMLYCIKYEKHFIFKCYKWYIKRSTKILKRNSFMNYALNVNHFMWNGVHQSTWARCWFVMDIVNSNMIVIFPLKTYLWNKCK